MRSGLRLLLERQPNLQVVAEAADGRQAVDMHREQALFDEAAIFRPRRQLLPDIAAFLPIDASNRR